MKSQVIHDISHGNLHHNNQINITTTKPHPPYLLSTIMALINHPMIRLSPQRRIQLLHSFLIRPSPILPSPWTSPSTKTLLGGHLLLPTSVTYDRGALAVAARDGPWGFSELVKDEDENPAAGGLVYLL